jgi:hypothetical protein
MGKTLKDIDISNAFLIRTSCEIRTNLTNGIASNYKASSQKRKQFPEPKETYRRKSLSAIHQIKD